MEPDNINSIVEDMARLKWACRRGMLELDVLLGNFLENAYSRLTLDEKKTFVALLSHSDPELFSWLMGTSVPEDAALLKIVNQIRQHARP
jgi:antitoxin CptB